MEIRHRCGRAARPKRREYLVEVTFTNLLSTKNQEDDSSPQTSFVRTIHPLILISKPKQNIILTLSTIILTKMRVATVLTALFAAFACGDDSLHPDRHRVSAASPSPVLFQSRRVFVSIYCLTRIYCFLFTYTNQLIQPYTSAHNLMSSYQICPPSTASKNQYNLMSISGLPCSSRRLNLDLSPISCFTGVMVRLWRVYCLAWE